MCSCLSRSRISSRRSFRSTDKLSEASRAFSSCWDISSFFPFDDDPNLRLDCSTFPPTIAPEASSSSPPAVTSLTPPISFLAWSNVSTTTVSPNTYQKAARYCSSNLTRSIANPTASLAAIIAFPLGRPSSIFVRGRNVALPDLLFLRYCMHSAAV